MTGARRLRIRHLYRRVSETGAPDLPLLSVYRDWGVVVREGRDDNFNKPSEDLSAYQVVRPGDLVLNKMKTWQGSLGVSPHLGIVSPAYFVARQVDEAEPRYLHHLLRSSAMISVYGARSKGIRPNQWDLPWDDFADITLNLPPISEQRAIANYLDGETARIDGLVVARRRQLESIEERRRIATDRIMALYSSGSDWPLVRLKYVVRGFVDTLHATAPDEEDGPGYIVGTGSIKGGKLDLSSARRCSAETLERWTSRATPRPGDVLLTREAPAGEAALVPDGAPLAPGQRVVLIQTDEGRLLPQLVVRAIYSRRAAEFFDLLGRETTVAHLNMSDIGAIPVVVPPMSVQHDVAVAIDRELRMLDDIAARMGSQVELLLERRQAVVTAAVTRQFEIPGVGT